MGSIFTWNALVGASARNGQIRQARQVVELMPAWSVVTFNTMMLAEGSCDSSNHTVFLCFTSAPERSHISWNLLLSSYIRSRDLHSVNQLFSKIPSTSVETWNLRLQLLTYPDVEEAFYDMPERDVVSWNSLFRAYAVSGHLQLARRLFDIMPLHSAVSWVSLFTAYADAGLQMQADSIFISMPMRNAVAWNACIAAKAEKGYLHRARLVFHKMPHHSIVSWNSLLQASARNGCIEQAHQAFDAMPTRDSSSWNTILLVNGGKGESNHAEFVFYRMPATSVVSWNIMVQVYARDEQPEKARATFDAMPQRDLLSWNNTLVSYHKTWEVPHSLKHFFNAMPQRDIVSWNTMLTALVCTEVELARVLRFFNEEMPEKDTVSWNTLMSMCLSCNHFDEALRLFKRMDVEGDAATATSYALAVGACSRAAALEQGRIIHSSMVESSVATTAVSSALIAMYGTCGCIGEAEQVFEEWRRRWNGGDEEATQVWNSMMTAYARCELPHRVLLAMTTLEAEGVRPDGATLGILLSCCARSGLVSDGLEYFVRLISDYGLVELESYACLVDLLGRSGRLHEAMTVVRDMPFTCNDVIRRGLLSVAAAAT